MVSYAGDSIPNSCWACLTVGLGWTARTRGEDSKLARRLGVSAVCLGVAVLALALMLV